MLLGGQFTGIAPDGVLCVQLVRDVAVVFARVTLANGGLHETRQRWQNVDRWVDTLVMQLTVDKDLPFGDVTRQIRDGVGDVWRNVSAGKGDRFSSRTIVRHS